MQLFKYQSVTDYSIDALEKRQWWYSNPLDFNDPFEFKLIIPDASSIGKVKNLDIVKRQMAKDFIEQGLVDTGKFLKTPQELTEMLLTAFNNLGDERLIESAIKRYQPELYKLGVVSLTENNDNILMWSHYADFHKGVCFEFNRDGAFSDYFVKVIYSDHYPELDFENFPQIEKMFTTQLVTKSSHWSYEKEWRCIRLAQGLFPYFGRLNGVIFGARISEVNKERVKAALRGEDIDFFQARLHPYEYRLVIDPCT